MRRPVATVVAPALLHVALPELGLAMHVFTRAGRAEVTLAGTVVRVVPVGRA